jgi:hypothetical protein
MKTCGAVRERPEERRRRLNVTDVLTRMVVGTVSWKKRKAS